MQVYVSNNGSVERASEAVRRGRMIKCKLCGEKGATLGCHKRSCRASFHLSCARDHGCLLQVCVCKAAWLPLASTLSPSFLLLLNPVPCAASHKISTSEYPGLSALACAILVPLLRAGWISEFSSGHSAEGALCVCRGLATTRTW